MRTISDKLVQFMNNELNKDESTRFKQRLHLEGLNGPDSSGFLNDGERQKIYDGLVNLKNHGKG